MRDRGFSLIECLVALAVVVTVFAPIMAMLTMGTKSAYLAGDKTVATIYAADVLEIIRGAPFEAFQADDKPMNLKQVLYEHNIPTGYEIDKYDQRFTVTAVVSPVDKDIPPAKMKRVTIYVQWIDKLEMVRRAQAGQGTTAGPPGEGSSDNPDAQHRGEHTVKLCTYFTPTR